MRSFLLFWAKLWEDSRENMCLRWDLCKVDFLSASKNTRRVLKTKRGPWCSAMHTSTHESWRNFVLLNIKNILHVSHQIIVLECRCSKQGLWLQQPMRILCVDPNCTGREHAAFSSEISFWRDVPNPLAEPPPVASRTLVITTLLLLVFLFYYNTQSRSWGWQWSDQQQVRMICTVSSHTWCTCPSLKTAMNTLYTWYSSGSGATFRYVVFAKTDILYTLQ